MLPGPRLALQLLRGCPVTAREGMGAAALVPAAWEAPSEPLSPPTSELRDTTWAAGKCLVGSVYTTGTGGSAFSTPSWLLGSKLVQRCLMAAWLFGPRSERSL